MSRTIQQLKYEADELLREKDSIIELQIEKKVNEIVVILTENPSQNSNDLKNILTMMATDIKYIVRQ